MNTSNEPKKGWTEEEDLFLEIFYSSQELSHLCEVLDRSKNSVIQRLKKIDVKNVIRWTQKDNDILIDNYSTKGIEGCLKQLGRNPSAIYHQVNRLGLSCSPELLASGHKKGGQKQQKSSYNKAKKIAESKKGKLITSFENYNTSRSKIEWTCLNKHIWKATAHDIIEGRWCPYCSLLTSMGEEITRKIFEYLFDKPFPKKRPKWLIGPKGGRMELDGYNEELGIAFEYQGQQHYKHVSRFPNFEDTKKRDKLKKELCKRNNLQLFEIKYFKDFNNKQFIFNKILEDIYPSIKISKKDFNPAIFDTIFMNPIRKLQNAAKRKNLTFLGIKFNAKFILQWNGFTKKYWYECNICKHIWEKAADIKGLYGCPYCSGYARQDTYTYEEAKKVIQKMNIKTNKEYKSKRKNDKKLPGSPRDYYSKKKEWINWYDFLGNKRIDLYYKNYIDAKISVLCLGIQTNREYYKKYKQDDKLPSMPDIVYKDQG